MARSTRRRAPCASTSVRRMKSADTTREGSMVEAPAARLHSFWHAFRNDFWGPQGGRAIAWNIGFTLHNRSLKLVLHVAGP
jgi:hypothetical protein